MKKLHYIFLLSTIALSQSSFGIDNNQSSLLKRTKNNVVAFKKRVSPYLKPENIIIGLVVTAAVVRLAFI